MSAAHESLSAADVPEIGFASSHLRSVAGSLFERADGVNTDAQALISDWVKIGEHYTTPTSDQLLSRVRTIGPPIAAYTDSHTQLATMLAFSANGFADFERERAGLLTRISNVRPEAATDDTTTLRSDIASFGRRLQEYTDDLTRAIARISGGTGGPLPAAMTTPKHNMSERYERALGAQTRRLLERLSTLSADKLAMLAAAHPDWLRLLIDNAPPADEVRTWWDSLTDTQRGNLLLGIPLVVGNLNGIAEGARIMANKRNLQARISHLQFMKDEGLLSDAELTELDNLTQLRDNAPLIYDTHGNRVESLSGGQQLLVFDPEKQAVATYRGPIDPTTGRIPADLANLAFFTPGTNSDLTNVAGNITAASRISDGTYGGTAVIYWQGGLFPKAQAWPIDLSTLSPGDGEVLGEKYAEFADGTSIGPDTRVTSVNHSYGNIIYSEAEMSGFTPDAHVALSGEGMGHLTDTGGKFVGDPAIERYSLIAPGDDVVGKQWYPSAGWAVNATYPSQQWEDSNYTDLATGSAHGHEITGHDLSGLLSQGSDSLRNVQYVVDGDNSRVTAAAQPSPDLTGAR